MSEVRLRAELAAQWHAEPDPARRLPGRGSRVTVVVIELDEEPDAFGFPKSICHAIDEWGRLRTYPAESLVFEQPT